MFIAFYISFLDFRLLIMYSTIINDTHDYA